MCARVVTLVVPHSVPQQSTPSKDAYTQSLSTLQDRSVGACGGVSPQLPRVQATNKKTVMPPSGLILRRAWARSRGAPAVVVRAGRG